MTAGTRFNLINAGKTIPYKVKKAAFINAVKDLDIDIESICLFLKNASALESQYIEVAGSTFTKYEMQNRERSLREAELLQIIFENYLQSLSE